MTRSAGSPEPPPTADDTPLPPPPPPPPRPPGADADVAVAAARPLRPGDLALGWRVVFASTWVAVIVALAAVWNTSVQLGLSTWWLGARGEPQPRPIQLAVFVAPLIVVLLAINRARHLAWWGLGAAGVVAAFGLGDLTRVTSIAAVELLIAAAGAVASLACLSGTYRPADRTTAADSPGH